MLATLMGSRAGRRNSKRDCRGARLLHASDRSRGETEETIADRGAMRGYG